MIRTISAFTSEIDDVDVAVAEIRDQLGPEDQLLTHTIGLIACIPDFIETGVVKALQDALSFDLIGQTTLAAAAPGSDTLEILSIFVITSDELEFVYGQTEPITGEDVSLLAPSYQAATGDRAPTDKPATTLIYGPLLLNVGGEFFVNTFNELTGKAPVFGSLAVDNTIDYHNSFVIYKGEASSNRLAFINVYGPLNPTFYLATISHEKVFDEKGVVTSSDGSQIKGVDGKPAVDFLKSKGLATDANGAIEGLNSFPYIVDYNDGTPPVVRVIFAITPEGDAVCLGDIPAGSTLGVGYFNDEDILVTTHKTLEDIASDSGKNALLFSCVGRYFTLGFEPEGEALAVHEVLDPLGKTYALTYSGAELSPVTNVADGVSLTNRFHNATFIAMVF
jgi:hypothetical protein